MNFDPARLSSLSASMTDDDCEVDNDELHRIATADARKKCASLKLASRIVGMANAVTGELSDSEVLASMSRVMQRLVDIRKAAIKVVGIDRLSPDFPHVFNAVTNSALDLVTEEWCWSQLNDIESRELSIPVISSLLEFAIRLMPERFDPELADVSVVTARRICIVESLPRLYNLINYFDYFQSNPEKLVNSLLRSVIEQAEQITLELTLNKSPESVTRMVLQRMYKSSTSLMCEVYKNTAQKDVLRIRELPELDRSILLEQYERLGGMNFQHILDQHRYCMRRTMQTADIIRSR